ncbi:hypothetical protein D9757_003397 [Collybiopsis confluens]|uniref:GPI-anchored wall transfer protein n=1 Tax=Collybiopsis confluens TaxID=2823264 RepID=A0A8H5HU38_9AGAR|nr:hypothetical protein D9757_003397 [Collybiopsis confluens]
MAVAEEGGLPNLDMLHLDMDYKTEKEAFVTGMTGSTVGHINLISCVAPVRGEHTVSVRDPALSNERANVVAHSRLSLTSLDDNICQLACNSGPLYISPSPSPPASASPAPPSKMGPIPSFTTYRAHMLLMTCLAILAVDFPVFPRSLVKCESFGVSLMDIGVGSFVFAQGIASAIPLIRTPSHLASPLPPKIFSAVRKSLPIIILGLIRVLLVKGTEYPEHVSEYGVHWNFFITLALVPIMEVLLHPLMIHMSVTAIGLVVAILQQFLLSKYHLSDYVLDAPRLNVISANKEGLVSLLGYFAVHLLGLTTGLLILPPSPSYFRRIQKSLRTHTLNDKELTERYAGRQNAKTATELSGYTVLWWSLMGLCRVFGLDGGNGVSRRMVNISYVFWICAYNVSFILCYLLLDMVFFPSPSSKKKNIEQHSSSSLPPLSVSRMTPHPLLDAINKNGLVVFLLANVATGVINLTIPTMYTSDFWAMVILCGYSYGICVVAWVLRGMKLRL